MEKEERIVRKEGRKGAREEKSGKELRTNKIMTRKKRTLLKRKKRRCSFLRLRLLDFIFIIMYCGF